MSAQHAAETIPPPEEKAMTIRTDRSPSTTPDISVHIDTSSGRATPEPADRRFRAMLHDGASVLLDGVESATSILPGGAVVSAAVQGARETVAGSSGSSSSASSIESALDAQSDTQMQYIELQQRMQEENRRFTTLSNVLKARHETAKTAIGNIR